MQPSTQQHPARLRWTFGSARAACGGRSTAHACAPKVRRMHSARALTVVSILIAPSRGSGSCERRRRV